MADREERKVLKSNHDKLENLMDSTSYVPPQIYSQSQSDLMILPQELRNMIIDHLFQTTTLTWTHWSRSDYKYPGDEPRPAQNALAILRTCHRLDMEISDTWLPKVQFAFGRYNAFVENFCNLPTATRQRIRRLHISIDLLWALTREQPRYGKIPYGTKLDQLTINTLKNEYFPTDIVDVFVNHSRGWKELRILAYKESLPNARFHHSLELLDQNTRFGPFWQLKLSYWNYVLECRDGKDRKPSVTIEECATEDELGYSTARVPLPGILAYNRLQSDDTIPARGMISPPLAPLRPVRILVTITRGDGVELEESG